MATSKNKFVLSIWAFLAVTAMAPLLWASAFQVVPVETTRFPGYIEIVYDSIPNLNPKLDFLVVMDNSGSMSTHQAHLQQHIRHLIEGLGAFPYTHYQIGVTTADMDMEGGKLLGQTKFVSANTPDGSSILKSNLTMPTQGSGVERLLDSVLAAFSEPNLGDHNKGFYRPEADLGVLLITDAEDQSVTGTLAAVEALKKMKSNQTVTAFGLLAGTENSECPPDNTNEAPIRLKEFISALNGKSYDLCSGAMGEILREIGSLASKSETEILVPMPVAAIPETIQVTYGSQVVPPGIVGTGWIYDPGAKVLTIGAQVKWQAQPIGSKLKVTFRPKDF